MKPEFDPAKNAQNIEKHGIDFETFEGFDEEPQVLKDTRQDYGESRFRAFGYIDGVAHCLVFTQRGNAIRLISLRRAHQKEIRRYEQYRQN